MLFVAGMTAAVVTVIASSRLVAARKHATRPEWDLFFKQRSKYGPYNLPMAEVAELLESDTDRYQVFTRLNVEDLNGLLSIFNVDIYKRVSSVSFADSSRREAGSSAICHIALFYAKHSFRLLKIPWTRGRYFSAATTWSRLSGHFWPNFDSRTNIRRLGGTVGTTAPADSGLIIHVHQIRKSLT